MEQPQNEIEVSPCIVLPDKMFLIGAIYGINAARKRIEDDPQPLLGTKEATSEEAEGIYIGHWLELHCAKCGSFYTFDNPNDVPDTNFKCSNKDCDNYIIVYGVGEVNMWRLGEFRFG